MECKLFVFVNFNYALLELIDTLWNVNDIDVVIANVRDIELIDTLWNVN